MQEDDVNEIWVSWSCRGVEVEVGRCDGEEEDGGRVKGDGTKGSSTVKPGQMCEGEGVTRTSGAD